jgi:hypothetical protein
MGFPLVVGGVGLAMPAYLVARRAVVVGKATGLAAFVALRWFAAGRSGGVLPDRLFFFCLRNTRQKNKSLVFMGCKGCGLGDLNWKICAGGQVSWQKPFGCQIAIAKFVSGFDFSRSPDEHARVDEPR